MTKVAFFIDNDNIKNVDCKDIIHGNPGIGGSEYMIILVAYLLSLRSNNIEVTIFCTNRGILPDNVSCLLCEDFGNGYSLALSKHFNYFVFRHTDYYVNNYLKRIKLDNSLKLIPWCHNFCSYSSLRFYSRTDAVFKIICVGKEQMELYIDHKAYLKSDYIYNIVPAYKSECNYSLDDVKNRENIVTYVGSLVPEKGFLYLAKAWPSIVKEIPNAQLYVIGSGRLYNRNQKLGRFGIAESKFEKQFTKYLCDSNSKILDNVHFLGILGAEKDEILKKTKVGVPNPSGATETFGISAVEMQLNGNIIVTKKCPGYLDTVFNGILYNNTNQLSSSIVSILKGELIDFCPIKKIADAFSIENIMTQWETLFILPENTHAKLHPLNINSNYGYKRAKILLYRLKSEFPIFYNLLPSLDNFLSVENKIYALKKLIKSIIKYA